MNSIDKQRFLIEQLQKQNNGETLDLIIPEHLQNKCVGYSGIFQDLNICLEALNELENIILESIIRRSLFTTVIILYGKCFTNSSNSRFPKLEKNLF